MADRQGPSVDPVVQGKLRNREKLAEVQRRADLREIMAMPAGRRFMYDMIFNRCVLMDLYPAQDSGIYRHEGKRSVGASLVVELQESQTESYILMIAEHMRDQETDKKLRDAAQSKREIEDGE